LVWRRSRCRRAIRLFVVVVVAGAAAQAMAQADLRVTFEVDRSRPEKVHLVGRVTNQGGTDVVEVNVTAEALDRNGRVVASGITYVEGRIPQGGSQPFTAVVPGVPGATRYRASVTSFRPMVGAGTSTQTP